MPASYPTIQSAVVAALDGDVVVVAPGSYLENIDFLGKAILVTSAGGPSVTTIDGSGCAPVNGAFCSVVTFRSGETATSVLRGFSVVGGSGHAYPAFGGERNGGGILCDQSSPTIVDCWIMGNQVGSGGAGGGVACNYDSSPRVLNCLIEGNFADYGGGVVADFNSSPWIENCMIASNEAWHGGGIKCNNTGSLTIRNCLVVDNHAISALPGDGLGGGIQILDVGAVTITGCTIVDNTTNTLGGGLRLSRAPTILVNSIVWENYADVAGPSLSLGEMDVAVSYSLVDGLGIAATGPGLYIVGVGVIDANPAFVVGPLGHQPDRYLSQVAAGQGADSICLDAGDPTVTPLGTTRVDLVADTGIVDIGFHYTTPTYESTFRRGDTNDDAAFNISDAVFLLSSLFTAGAPAPVCADAADMNDDGSVNLADAVYGLSSLFLAGAPAPPVPHSSCGTDVTVDTLDCVGPVSACP